MTIKDRILEYLELKGISINKAESMLGWSKSALLKSNNLSGERISEFVHKFPDLNLDWLLKGEGEMLKSSQVVGDISNSNVSGVNVSGKEIHISSLDAYNTLLQIVEKNQKSVEIFQSQIDRLITMLEKRL